MKTRAALLSLTLALSLFAQTRTFNATITVDGASHPITTTAQRAYWVTVLAKPTNSATNCSSSSMTACPVFDGWPLLPGASLTLPVISGAPGYPLGELSYTVQTGDVLYIKYAQ